MNRWLRTIRLTGGSAFAEALGPWALSVDVSVRLATHNLARLSDEWERWARPRVAPYLTENGIIIPSTAPDSLRVAVQFPSPPEDGPSLIAQIIEAVIGADDIALAQPAENNASVSLALFARRRVLELMGTPILDGARHLAEALASDPHGGLTVAGLGLSPLPLPNPTMSRNRVSLRSGVCVLATRKQTAWLCLAVNLGRPSGPVKGLLREKAHILWAVDVLRAATDTLLPWNRARVWTRRVDHERILFVEMPIEPAGRRTAALALATTFERYGAWANNARLARRAALAAASDLEAVPGALAMLHDCAHSDALDLWVLDRPETPSMGLAESVASAARLSQEVAQPHDD